MFKAFIAFIVGFFKGRKSEKASKTTPVAPRYTGGAIGSDKGRQNDGFAD